MRERKITAVLATFSVAYGLATTIGRAETSAVVLKEIADTASQLCGYMSESGSKSTTQITGDVNAELSGLAKRLANLGVKGTGTIDSSQYEGVVQEQLADTLKDIRQCRENI